MILFWIYLGFSLIAGLGIALTDLFILKLWLPIVNSVVLMVIININHWFNDNNLILILVFGFLVFVLSLWTGIFDILHRGLRFKGWNNHG